MSEIITEVLRVIPDENRLKDGYTLYPAAAPYSIDDIDSIILFQLTENTELHNPFLYLNDSFNRCRSYSNKDQQIVVDKLKGLIIGYTLISFQIESFCLNGSFSTYIQTLLSSHDLDEFADLFTNVINRAIQESSLHEFVNNLFNSLVAFLHSRKDQKFNLCDYNYYNSVLSLYEFFLNFKSIASIFTKIDNFLPNDLNNPQTFEILTILGPILALSSLDLNVSLKNYSNELESSIPMINESLESENKILIDRLFNIIDKLFRGSNDSRNDTLQYFAILVNKNHLRRGENPNLKKLSSNSIMTNITLILIKFSQPFLDVTFRKISKIDIDYFNSINLLIDLSNETRMNSDFNEANEFYDKEKNVKDINFISNCFFLSLTYLHYGLGGTIAFKEKIDSQVKKIKDDIENLTNASLNENQNNNFLSSFTDLQLKNLKKSLNFTQCLNHSLNAFFTNRSIQLEIFDFISGASTFLLRVIDPKHEFPFNKLSLPLIPDQIGFENIDNADHLRKNAPIPYKYYPEFIIEGLLNYSFFITQYNNNPLFRNTRLNAFVELLTTILRCPELISNPHLKGKVVQLLSYGALPLVNDNPGFMLDIFENDELVKKNLLFALLDFYVIVEKTGSSSQFYDKFNSRYSISIILEQLYYRIPTYKKQLEWQLKNNSNFFIRFIARMLNDLTFLLDEGLTSLAELHDITQELNRRAKNEEKQREETDEELESKLSSAKRQAKSSCGLAAKSMTLFKIYTKDFPKPFTSPEIVDRLASMLDYNLVSLVGPKCNTLKVKNPQDYSFNPKSLLLSLATVYINLSEQEEFIIAVARDGRSYEKALFDRAIHILNFKTGLADDEFCIRLNNFVNKVESQKLAEEEEDQDYNDVPDEYLDPLMYTIMKDPVILPTSHVTIDRSTIKAHLLSDSTDPFNREPLTLDQVKPNDELKEKILQYKLRKQEEKKKNKQNIDNNETKITQSVA